MCVGELERGRWVWLVVVSLLSEQPAGRRGRSLAGPERSCEHLECEVLR